MTMCSLLYGQTRSSSGSLITYRAMLATCYLGLWPATGTHTLQIYVAIAQAAAGVDLSLVHETVVFSQCQLVDWSLKPLSRVVEEGGYWECSPRLDVSNQCQWHVLHVYFCFFLFETQNWQFWNRNYKASLWLYAQGHQIAPFDVSFSWQNFPGGAWR